MEETPWRSASLPLYWCGHFFVECVCTCRDGEGPEARVPGGGGLRIHSGGACTICELAGTAVRSAEGHPAAPGWGQGYDHCLSEGLWGVVQVCLFHHLTLRPLTHTHTHTWGQELPPLAVLVMGAEPGSAMQSTLFPGLEVRHPFFLFLCTLLSLWHPARQMDGLPEIAFPLVTVFVS